MSGLIQRIGAMMPSQQHNIRTFKSTPFAELSGSLGDLGTLLPLLIALTLTNSIALSSTLVFTGLANILTGICFSIPLPVQPMKAIAAVAIARRFSIEQTASAGLFVSGVIGVASITGLLNWIGRVIPIPVVKGIQVGAGLSLILSAGSSLLQPLRWITPGQDNLLCAGAATLFLLVTTVAAAQKSNRTAPIPYALIVCVIGLIISAATWGSSGHSTPSFLAMWRPSLLHPSGSDFKVGSLDAGLGQLPLTTLNSIIAVTHLAADLLPAQPTPTPTALGLSILLMNGIGCAFGAMPACHGSGGLAGQYRFGARSGASVIILGLVKLVLGLIVDESWLLELLRRFPKSLLGVMVIAAGLELAKVGESLNLGAKDLWTEATDGNDQRSGLGTRHAKELNDQERADRWTVMLVTVAGLLAFRNDAVGVLLGMCWHWSQRVSAWLQDRRRIRIGGS